MSSRLDTWIRVRLSPEEMATLGEVAYEAGAESHGDAVRAMLARPAQAFPAWIPGPPTEPGRWELTWRWPVTGQLLVRVVVARPGGDRLYLDCDLDAQRTLGSTRTLATMLLAHRRYDPEPYRGPA